MATELARRCEPGRQAQRLAARLIDSDPVTETITRHGQAEPGTAQRGLDVDRMLERSLGLFRLTRLQSSASGRKEQVELVGIDL